MNIVNLSIDLQMLLLVQSVMLLKSLQLDELFMHQERVRKESCFERHLVEVSLREMTMILSDVAFILFQEALLNGGSEYQVFRLQKFQSFSVSPGFQSFRVSVFHQGFRVSEFQCFSVSDVYSQPTFFLRTIFHHKKVTIVSNLIFNSFNSFTLLFTLWRANLLRTGQVLLTELEIQLRLVLSTFFL